jgi:Spy/CpxP family protein refolding chaperone
MSAGHTVRRLVLAVAITAFCWLPGAAPASAQGSKWWQSDTYRRELGLTQEQSDRIEAIFQRSSPALRAQKEAFEMAQREFNKVVDTNDEAQLLAYIGAVESARSELNKSRMLMLSRMRRVLTPDQRARLDALRQQRTQTSSSGSSHRR